LGNPSQGRELTPDSGQLYTPAMPKKLYCVRLNAHQIKALNKLAKIEDVPAAQLIRKAIDAYLEKQK
jgi:hypothetical protein